MPCLVDVHTHVQFAAYASDYREVVRRALDDGTWLVNIGTQRDTSAKAVEIAEGYPEGVYAAIGLHPVHTEKSFRDEQELGGGEAVKAFTSRGEEVDADFYIKLGRNNKVVAVGECGLDYYHLGEESKARQEKALVTQIEAAKELGKPLMIHCRNAFPDLIKIFKRESAKLLNPSPGIIHFFTGTTDDAAALKEMGFYFSFGGVTTFARDYDEAIKLIGLDRILLETDAPYVSPVPYRGKRNEPAYVRYVPGAIANVLGLDSDTVAEATTANAMRVLRLKPKSV
ncbi:MAG: hydrolase TatD [Candidatus Colwellbacteria bacterium CG_4_9_14_0_2_um_filter_50_12]|uniref:Hydrolase TatD n=1 Tax=Candidatus Colwellbacteria bacterium CG_4_9_14_0_2_um_filter_50_12 TaxID=1974538 RepID=A0A2M8G1K0_9BACT|nr:MAG: hydrolase TatD [Candidatus Colwellbacteria bacterium CG_4_9_14_0_2_um_filter_50_12]